MSVDAAPKSGMKVVVNLAFLTTLSRTSLRMKVVTRLRGSDLGAACGAFEKWDLREKCLRRGY